MKVLCHVNHYWGPSRSFRGGSTGPSAPARRAIVERTIRSLRAAVPSAKVRICGIPGHALVPLDEDFTPEDPRLLVYESLGRMADRLAEFDWFINLEDDIELNEAAFRNALDFEPLSRPDECLLPNRMELRASGPQCIDLLALPGWTQQERSLFGRTFRVARNPHSGLLMLSREKFAYALRSVDRSFRGRVVGGLMASAYAHYHRPLTLYRCFDDPSFHSVVHLDPYTGGLPRGARLEFSALIPSGSNPHHLPLIVRTLRQIPQIREILVGNHDPLQTPDLPGATVVNTPRNSLCLSRYALVPLAAHDNLWLQDGDLQLQPPQFAALLAQYAKDQGRIVGCRGRNLRNGRYVSQDAFGQVDVVLGQTMMFHRSLLRHAFETFETLGPPMVDDDIAFSLSCRRKHLAVNVEPLADLDLAGEATPDRQPGHEEQRQAAVDRALRHLAAHPVKEAPHPAQDARFAALKTRPKKAE